jgi:ribonuclease P protein component
LTRRSEFQAAAKGWRVNAPAFTLQARRRTDDHVSGAGEQAGSNAAPTPGPPRFGLTATRKIGGAVERNRIKRRLRAALRPKRDQAGEALGRDGHDYVLVARREALATSFEALEAALSDAMRRIHAPRPQARRGPASKTPVSETPAKTTRASQKPGPDEAEGTSRNDT